MDREEVPRMICSVYLPFDQESFPARLVKDKNIVSCHMYMYRIEGVLLSYFQPAIFIWALQHFRHRMKYSGSRAYVTSADWDCRGMHSRSPLSKTVPFPAQILLRKHNYFIIITISSRGGPIIDYFRKLVGSIIQPSAYS